MGFEPLNWYCRPVANGVWTKEADSSFGAYTPCAIDSLVISISHLVLLGLCLYRIWLIKKHAKAQRFCLRSNWYNYLLGLLSGYCVAEPLSRLVMGISVFNLDGETGLAPFEATSSIIEALAWCSMVILIGLETKIYIKEFRWYVRFGVVYVLVGDAALLNVILPMRDFYNGSALYLYISMVLCEVLFGVLLLVYVPNLNPYPGYVIIRSESLDNVEYEALPDGEQICPERQANIFSKVEGMESQFYLGLITKYLVNCPLVGIFFGWIAPLIQQGSRRPITEKDVWKLDTWDQTETLMKKFVSVSSTVLAAAWFFTADLLG
ncbi:hypothetical protein SLEP1_g12687 [Rubroshorea leprosula]|uniref:Uncharacterized protein n=1 Tax=Rubroshorea leprosula TaxID=152421 RepID=A0AAV5IJ62_9ROSI|nr:hypothetical protein SLEP1_g12687 [Rubroshorea leprosula]